MSKILVIAEKPSLAGDIAKALGTQEKLSGYYETDTHIITWAYGHLLQQAPPDTYTGKQAWHFKRLPIVRDTIIMIENDDPRSKKQLPIIKRLMSRADHIIHAGDNDREGQLIIDELLDFYHFKGKVERIIVNDANLIDQALHELRPNSEFSNLSNAAWARSVADWDVGMNMSRALILTMGVNLGVGRVQTPVLRMITDRHHIIHGFSEQLYYDPVATCQHDNGTFTAAWQSTPETPSLDDKGRISVLSVAEQVALESTGHGMVKSVQHTAKKVSPPLGYVLGKIQSEAGKKFGLSLEDSMAVCQSLYDTKKVMTYPRVECPYLPSTMLDDIDDRIDAIRTMVPSLASLCDQIDTSLRSKIWNDKKVAAESHHALMFTGKTAKLSVDELNIMTLIGERILMQFLPSHEYIQSEILVQSGGHTYKASARRATNDGWKIVSGGSKYPSIPDVNQGDPVSVQVTVEHKKTKPPAPYTKSSLIDDMMTPSRLTSDPRMLKVLKKAKGIGTPATRPSIVKRLISHDLVAEKKKGKNIILEPTRKGEDLIKQLASIDGGEKMSDPSTTALWEMCFDKIATGELDKDDFLTAQRKLIDEVILSASGLAPAQYDCPDCQSLMIQKVSKKAPYKGEIYYTCDNDECSTMMNAKGEKIEKAKREYGDTCPACNKRTIKRKGKDDSFFFSCEGYPTCKYVYNDGAENCPTCNWHMRQIKDGSRQWCPNCKGKK